MNKETLLSLVIERLSRDLEVLVTAARAAHEAATHEENLPDNKYDTLSLEASYIAQGQANRAQEIRGAIGSYQALVPREFDDDSQIRLGAVVTLAHEEGELRKFFIGPEAGGLKVLADGAEVMVITPGSPLGRNLLGKKVGDEVIASSGQEFEIVGIS